MQVELHVLWIVGYLEETGVYSAEFLEARPEATGAASTALIVFLSEQQAADFKAELETVTGEEEPWMPLRVNLEDIERICAAQDLGLVTFWELENPNRFTTFPVASASGTTAGSLSHSLT